MDGECGGQARHLAYSTYCRTTEKNKYRLKLNDNLTQYCRRPLFSRDASRNNHFLLLHVVDWRVSGMPNFKQKNDL